MRTVYQINNVNKFLLEKCDKKINHNDILYKEVDCLKKWSQPCARTTDFLDSGIICTHFGKREKNFKHNSSVFQVLCLNRKFEHMQICSGV